MASRRNRKVTRASGGNDVDGSSANRPSSSSPRPVGRPGDRSTAGCSSWSSSRSGQEGGQPRTGAPLRLRDPADVRSDGSGSVTTRPSMFRSSAAAATASRASSSAVTVPADRATIVLVVGPRRPSAAASRSTTTRWMPRAGSGRCSWWMSSHDRGGDADRGGERRELRTEWPRLVVLGERDDGQRDRRAGPSRPGRGGAASCAGSRRRPPSGSSARADRPSPRRPWPGTTRRRPAPAARPRRRPRRAGAAGGPAGPGQHSDRAGRGTQQRAEQAEDAEMDEHVSATGGGRFLQHPGSRLLPEVTGQLLVRGDEDQVDLGDGVGQPHRLCAEVPLASILMTSVVTAVTLTRSRTTSVGQRRGEVLAGAPEHRLAVGDEHLRLDALRAGRLLRVGRGRWWQYHQRRRGVQRRLHKGVRRSRRADRPRLPGRPAAVPADGSPGLLDVELLCAHSPLQSNVTVTSE